MDILSLRVAFGLFLALTLIATGCTESDDGSDAGGSGEVDSGSSGPTGGGGSPTSDAGGDDASMPVVAEGCAEPTGEGTEHQGAIDADETWTAAASPHVVTFNVNVNSATLTIEPCAVVRIRGGYSINVDGTETAEGAIVAHGESIDNVGAPPTRRPVTFERDVTDEPWASILADSYGRIDFEIVDLVGGGDPASAPHNGGTLIANGAGGNSGLTENLRVVDVVVTDSGTYGVNVVGRAGFSEDSSGLVIRNAGSLPPNGNVDTSFPLHVQGPAVSTIPEGSYEGATDAIALTGAGSLTDAEITFRSRGVPYHVLSVFSMTPEAGVPSTLTLEAGVELRFFDGQGMTLGTSNGMNSPVSGLVKVVAQGTETDPILLTSGEEAPAAGDWSGIAWAAGPSDGNVMSFVTIEYAGGDSGTQGFGCGPGDNDAALIITNWRPGDAFITDCTFSNSASGGIVSGWSSDEVGPDLSDGNTFTNVAGGCEVTRWADGDGSCPMTPPLCL